MPLLTGERLQNRYRIVSLLAAGSSGATYRAWDDVDKRDVAIKEHLDRSPDAQRLFRAEADRLTRLKHEQIPELLDHFCLDSGCYLVSRFVDGVDLQSLLNQYGPLPSDLIIGWLQATAKPLQYLHEQGQLHLGIKPANVRLAPDGRIFLVDSGLPGMGLPAINDGYAAPELAAQTEATPASDIFSLGATLYTLLTAQVPPDPLHRESGLVDLQPAREVNPNVEPYLSIVANRAMSLRPDARYETAVDFADALARPP
ncbi:MAG: serine/threonine-protein kinase, partial [Anaerolineae bacterium]